MNRETERSISIESAWQHQLISGSSPKLFSAGFLSSLRPSLFYHLGHALAARRCEPALLRRGAPRSFNRTGRRFGPHFRPAAFHGERHAPPTFGRHASFALAPSVDLVLLKTLARGRRWFEELAAGRAASVAEIAQREGVHVRYVGRLIRLAFLAPEIVEAIAAGRQPAGLTAEILTRRTRLCADWEGQKRALGFAAKPPP